MPLTANDFDQVFARVATLLQVADEEPINQLLTNPAQARPDRLDRRMLERGIIDEPTRDLLERLTRYHLGRAGGHVDVCLKQLTEGPLGILGLHGMPPSSNWVTKALQQTEIYPDPHPSKPASFPGEKADGQRPPVVEVTEIWNPEKPVIDRRESLFDETLENDELSFVILGQKGRGGLGEVFIARDLALNREVALKVIQRQHSDDPLLRTRFEREVQITSALEHPSIVPVYSKGYYPDGRPYYTMKLIEGGTLEEAIQKFHASPAAKTSSLELRRLIRHLINVCEAIGYAHSEGVIHRDLKPLNVVLGKFGETILLDWGVARKTGSALVNGTSTAAELASEPIEEATPCPPADPDAEGTRAGSTLGTPRFMSPEQAAGDWARVDSRSDLYSLGAMLYCLLTGEPPLAEVKDAAELKRRVIAGEITAAKQIKPEVPLVLDAICRRAMKRLPEDRHPTAQQLADDLERWLADEPVTGIDEPVLVKIERWERKHRLLIRVGGAALALIAIVGLLSSLMVNHAREIALARRAEAEAARVKGAEKEVKSRLMASRMALEKSQNLGKTGEYQEALLWSARALELADRADPSLESTIRRNLSAFAARIPELLNVVPHDSRLICLAVSPDGELYATGCEDGSIHLSRISTGQHVGEVPRHSGPINRLAFSPDSQSLLSLSEDGSAQVWDRKSRRPRFQPINLSKPIRLGGFSPDGRFLLTVTSQGLAQLWDASTGRARTKPLANRPPVLSMAWSPASDLFALGTSNHQVVVREAKSGEPHGSPLKALSLRVTCLAFSPDGQTLAAGGQNPGALDAWSVATGEPLFEAKSLPGVNCVAFSGDGSKIVTGYVDSGIDTWGAADGARISTSAIHRNQVNSLTFSGQPSMMVTSSDDHTARVWDGTSIKPLDPPLIHPGPVTETCLTPDGQLAITACKDGATRVWRLPGGLAAGKAIPHGSPIRAPVRYLTDGSGLATATQGGVLSLFDPRTGQLRYQRQAHQDTIMTLAVSPDGSTIVTGSDDRKVRLWDARTGQPRGDALAHKEAVRRVAISPDSQLLATAEFGGPVHLWNLTTQQKALEPVTFTSRVLDLAFSPDGKSLVIGTFSGELWVWDIGHDGRLRGPAVHQEGIRDVAVSSDGIWVATASTDATARVWRFDNLAPVGSPMIHQSAVWGVEFHPNGRSLLTCSFDGKARLWDPATGRQIGETMRHEDMVFMARFSPDGHLVATASRDRTARLWDSLSGLPLGPPLNFGDMTFSVDFHPNGRQFAAGTGGPAAFLCELPSAWPGAVSTLKVWSSRVTNMTLEESGLIRVLKAQEQTAPARATSHAHIVARTLPAGTNLRAQPTR